MVLDAWISGALMYCDEPEEIYWQVGSEDFTNLNKHDLYGEINDISLARKGCCIILFKMNIWKQRKGTKSIHCVNKSRVGWYNYTLLSRGMYRVWPIVIATRYTLFSTPVTSDTDSSLCSSAPGDSGERSKSRNRIYKVHQLSNTFERL